MSSYRENAYMYHKFVDLDWTSELDCCPMCVHLRREKTKDTQTFVVRDICKFTCNKMCSTLGKG